MNIAQVLVEQARTRPDQTAIIDRTQRVTFGDLDRLSAVAAEDLRRAGLSPGDRALLFCPMSARLYVVLIGLFRIGAAAVVLDPSAGRSVLDRCCRRVAPRAFIGVPRAHVLRLLAPAVRAIPTALVIGRGFFGLRSIGRDGMADRRDIEPSGNDAPALITFTSGSTGEPKAVVRTHGFLLAQHRVLAESLELAAGQVDLATLPVFVLANLGSGVTSVIADADLRAPGAIDPVPVLRQISRERPTRTVASPALLLRLSEHARSAGGSLDSLEHVFTGGAPVFARTLDALRAAAPRASVSALYGSTEAEPIAHLPSGSITDADRAAMRSGAGLLAGQIVPQIELRILPDRWGRPIGPFERRPAFEAAVTQPGEPGEIVVSGPHVLPGYLDGRGDAETKFTVEGRIWHRTGDAGYVDRSGRLWLLGRCAARLDDASGHLYPFTVESAAMEWPWVQAAALAAHAGERLLAVQLARYAPPDATATLRAALAWASLAAVVRIDRMPLDARHNAKVDYTRLRALLDAVRARHAGGAASR